MKEVVHVYSFICVFNAPNIQDETAYINFTKNTINAKLPEPGNERDLIRIIFLREHVGNITKIKAFFLYESFFTDKIIIAKPCETGKDIDEKN